MMGVARITAIIISTREDIVTTFGGPDAKTGKYAGWITLPAEDRFRPLLNTMPIYDSGAEAEAAMEDAVRVIRAEIEREMDGENPIDHVMGRGPAAEAVKEVVSLSKKHQ